MLSTKRSRSGSLGFFGSTRMWLKNTLTTSSTQEREPPGWPLPALAVMLMISRRTALQIGLSSAVCITYLHLGFLKDEISIPDFAALCNLICADF